MKFLLSFLIIISALSCSKTRPIPPKKIYSNNYLSEEDLAKINFKNHPIVPIKVKDKFFYVRQDGKIIETVEYDGKADEFSDGLARTKLNGKIGFFNSNLEIVLKPIYDFAFPFHDGVAEICMGCKDNGKESLLDGGRWKKINREGLVIEEE